jgi:hypothetical protein
MPDRSAAHIQTASQGDRPAQDAGFTDVLLMNWVPFDPRILGGLAGLLNDLSCLHFWFSALGRNLTPPVGPGIFN